MPIQRSVRTFFGVAPTVWSSSTNRTVLHEHFLGTSSVADLNRDGWLDLVLEPFGPEHGGEKEKLIRLLRRRGRV